MRLSLVFNIPGMPFDGNTLEEKSLGGSETAGLSMAKEMSKLGHHVRVFCNTEKISKDKVGVEYYPIQLFKRFATTTPHDVCIGQRDPSLFGNRLASKLNMLWVHDLAQLRSAQLFKSSLWNVDKVITVSQYHTDQYKKVYDLPDDVFMTSRNGVDLSMAPNDFKRDPYQLVYAARPERGLDNLLEEIFPAIQKREPKAKLVICGYDNTVPQMADFYGYLKGMADKNPSITWAGHLTKPELYKLYSESGLYVYPTPSNRAKSFREVSCISVMEAQMCGLPVITSNKGALSETLSCDARKLIEGDPWTKEYQEDFVNQVISVFGDSAEWSKMNQAGRRAAKNLSWAGLAREWSRAFVTFISLRNSNYRRLAHHFLRQSDVIMAEKIVKEINDDNLKREIKSEWGFIKDGDDTRAQYESIGLTHTDVFEGVPHEPRFQMLAERLKSMPEIKSVLDFGCAHGGYAVNLSNLFPELYIQGIDIDKHSIEWAERNKKDRAKYPDNLSFRVGTPDIDLRAEEKYDALICFEVLEHTEKPWEVIDKLERWIKPGGTVFITTPYGPWEEDSYDNYPFRCHVWELGLEELKDMFGKKKGVIIDSQYNGQSKVENAPLGFNFTQYTKSDIKAGKVDIKRKMKIQRPRQTVSLSMICGPGAEKTLEWALDSVKTIADEIIIADCGMSDDALRIALKYKAKIIEGKNPREVGFDVARNITLPYCTMDWVLWLDSDERIMDGRNLHKYLRENMYHGYSIRQHHFAVDTDFTPDLPVRLFRNRSYKGKKLKFFGSCHEHPETELNKGTGPVIVLSDVNIAHVGYLAESGRKERFFRNFPLMQMSLKKYPDRLLNKYFMMRDNMILNNYELQGNGGQITNVVAQRCQQVISLYREHFCGKGSYMNTDAIDFYSQACRMLNLGAEVAIAVNSAQGETPKPEVKVYRFASTEDLQAELSKKATEALEQYCSPSW